MNLRQSFTCVPALLLAVLLTACGEDVSGGEVIAGGLGLYALVSILAFVIVIVAVLDLVKKPYPLQKKLIWGAIIFFVPFLGAILYFLIGRNKETVF